MCCKDGLPSRKLCYEINNNPCYKNFIQFLSRHRITKRVLSINCCLKTHIVWVKVNSRCLFWMLNIDAVFFHFGCRKRSPISCASHVCPIKKGAYLLPWQPGSAERWLGRWQEKGQSAQVKTQSLLTEVTTFPALALHTLIDAVAVFLYVLWCISRQKITKICVGRAHVDKSLAIKIRCDFSLPVSLIFNAVLLPALRWKSRWKLKTPFSVN